MKQLHSITTPLQPYLGINKEINNMVHEELQRLKLFTSMYNKITAPQKREGWLPFTNIGNPIGDKVGVGVE